YAATGELIRPATSPSFSCRPCFRRVHGVCRPQHAARKPEKSRSFQTGPIGNYLFELAAQPGGPQGRSNTTTGSKPNTRIDRPRGEWPACTASLRWNHLAPCPVRVRGSRAEAFHQEIGVARRPGHTQYDAAGRLFEVDTDGALSARYAYDGNSNRTGALRGGVPTLGMVDAQDRLTEWGGLVFTYTPNGELASRLDTGTSALTQYGYDSSGALRTVALPSGDLIEYVLDPAGRRIGKKVNGVLEQAWLYRDGLRPIAELDGMGNVVSTFVYATGLNVPDTMVRGGVTYRILRDHLGSVRLVVDVATATVAQRMEHDEWGRVLVDSAPGFQPFGYAGGFWDPDTGLVHFGAREYDPEIARWTSKDPIGFGGGDANFYGYVLGDPVNGIDPGGLFFTTVDAYASANPSDFGEILAAIHETGGGRRGMRCEGARGGGVFRIAGVAGSAVQGVRAVVGMYRLARSVARGVRDFWRLWRSSNWTVPLSGLSSTPLLQAATQPFQGGSLTNAGRALPKHPEVVGQDAQTLRQVLPSDAAVNAAAEGAVAGILSSGSGTLRQIPRYGGVLEVVGGSGFGARWSIETGQFIGFINP
ncbi:MAG: RHS repeat-associated core domain-containing protein, partial [Deltaproteobacteria bacterium]|nr:RHS repeat-associated core domain-containing protein [Deltaproteobacteria bacterium]